MSILIKGMEMPKSCIWRDGKCPLLGDDDDCKLQDCQEDWTWEDQYKGCPLSEAPEPCKDLQMWKIIPFEKNMEHIVSELICIKCMERWIDVRPSNVWLKDVECPNCGKGYVIMTGQELNGE